MFLRVDPCSKGLSFTRAAHFFEFAEEYAELWPAVREAGRLPRLAEKLGLQVAETRWLL